MKYLDINVLYAILCFLDEYFYINLASGEKSKIYMTLMKIKVLLYDGDTLTFYLAKAYIRSLQPFTFEGHISKFLKFHDHKSVK